MSLCHSLFHRNSFLVNQGKFSFEFSFGKLFDIDLMGKPEISIVRCEVVAVSSHELLRQRSGTEKVLKNKLIRPWFNVEQLT